MQRFRNVIFDVDGLIADTEPLHQRAINVILQITGVDFQFDVDDYGRIMTGRSILENAEFIRERFALAAPAEDIALAHDGIFNVLVSDANNIEPMAGLDELLNFLFAQNVTMAVASGSGPGHIEKILRAVNLASTFDVKVGGTRDIKPKPAPDLYLKALRLLRGNPAESLALEDSISGVRAARAADLFVIAVQNAYTKNQDLSDANVVVSSLSEAKDYLERAG